MFIENFKSVEDIISEYAAPENALKDTEILVAWYGYGDYCGSSIVIFKKDDKLYEVNGSHCSCNGLEGQWEPEETTWAALAGRNYWSEDCEGGTTAKEAILKLVRDNT